ncbi:MAG: DUF975 family protein [Clostridiales bacterium]|nr:DUF975 family protein [Clostridiales bacterium]
MNEGIFFRIAVKRQAKAVLFKNLIKSIGITLIFLLVNFSLMLIRFPIQDKLNSIKSVFISLILGFLPVLLNLLIISPFTLGFLEFGMRLADGKPVSVGDIFLWFGEGKRYIKSVLINVEYYIITVVIALIAYVLPASVLAYSLNAGYNGISLFIMLIMVVEFIFVAARILTYVPGFFLLAEDAEKKPWNCLKESRKLFKKKKWDLFSFYASFFGWGLMIFLIFTSEIGMELTKSGYLSSLATGFIDTTAIPTAIMMNAAIRGFLAVGLFLLYVAPYMMLATAYYIKGTYNPNLFHIHVPAWYSIANKDAATKNPNQSVEDNRSNTYQNPEEKTDFDDQTDIKESEPPSDHIGGPDSKEEK